MSMIPSLNLRNVRREDQVGATAIITTPHDTPSGGNPPLGSTRAFVEGETPCEEYEIEDSYRDYSASATPHYSRVDASELLGCSVYDITDVPTLHAKLIEAQKIFIALEQQYERSLESKERQLLNLVSQLLPYQQLAPPSGAPVPPSTITALHLQQSRQNKEKYSARSGGDAWLSNRSNPPPYQETASSRLRMSLLSNRTPRELSARSTQNLPSYRSQASYVTPRVTHSARLAQHGRLTPSGTGMLHYPLSTTPVLDRTSGMMLPLTSADGTVGNSLLRRYQPATKKGGTHGRAMTPRY